MGVIDFRRMGRGGGNNGGELSDLRVYATSYKDSNHKRQAIGLRVSPAVMKRMRWIAGDKVVASFNDAEMQWTLKRVHTSDGNVLSCVKGERSASVKFSCDASTVKACGLEVGNGYDCRIVSDDGDTAVFQVE